MTSTGELPPSSSSSKASHDSRDGAPLNEQIMGASPNEQIRMRAYQLYVDRGEQQGDGVADWLQAEREYHERS